MRTGPKRSSATRACSALAEEQLEGRLSIAPRVALTTSEVLTDETSDRVERAWGSLPLNVYAATEAPGIATASLERVGMHVWEESLVLEVVDEHGRPVPPGSGARCSSRISSTARSR